MTPTTESIARNLAASMARIKADAAGERQTINLTAYRKGRRLCVFVPNGDGVTLIKTRPGCFKVEQISWQDALAEEQFRICDGWEVVT